jgi:hypothetical protein
VGSHFFGPFGSARRTFLLICVVTLGVTAACSSNTATVAPPRSVEKSAAVDAGDNECTSVAAAQKQLVDEFKHQHPQATADDARAFLIDTLSPRLEQFVGDFHAIGEPTKDKTQWDALVNGLDQDLTDYKAQINTNSMDLLTAKPFAQEAKDFTAYGFKQCQTQLS